MRFKVLSVATCVALFMMSCAPYKQLKPKPELSFGEQGYIELKNDKKDFELKKEKKYFIQFPAPKEDHFYIVLDIPFKKKVTSYFTNSFADKKTVGPKLADETPFPDTMSVYPVDTKSPAFFWMIETGPQENLIMKMKYRYAPQWRFKFETKHSAYKEILAKNVVDRGAYKGIGTATKLDGFDFVSAKDTVKRHEAALEAVYKELLAIESIFPKSIVNSTDEAYQNYKSLRVKLEDEMNFQKAWLAALDFFNKEKACRGNPSEFLAKLDDFTAYFAGKSILAPNVIAESQRIMKNRLDEVMPFLSMRLSGKEDGTVLDPGTYFTPSLPKLRTMLEKADMAVPQDLAMMIKFVTDFDAKSKTVSALRDSMEKIGRHVKEGPQFPSDEFFKNVVSRISSVQSGIPSKIDEQYGKYAGYKSSTALNADIAKLTADVAQHLGEGHQAEALVQQLNIMKMQSDFGGMESLLLSSKHLDFVLDKYKDLDKMSLDQQSKSIRSALAGTAWQLAESGLKKLHTDQNFLNPAAMLPLKESVVRDLEDSLYSTVERVTRGRVNKFCEDKVTVLENVDSLYTDSVFLPVYDIKFSSGSQNRLIQKKDALVADLAKLKDYEFPAKAIKLCYEQFMKNPDDNGVLKARAVVTHGAHYKGDDKDLKIRIAECNPQYAKKITKPKDYRRVFALPITDNRKGKNKYYVRLNVDIPTDANFPVYDVNIKLPKEISQNAATTQWYDEILLNKKPLKNEGRFTISAPSAANDFECQITPVQMNKDQNNILEINFTHHSFKAFPVSVMVQKPIIKKN
jgi:hypothetical protein